MQNPQLEKRKFKGVWIPREIWLDEGMSLVEKALLVEIDSLDNEDGCTAGNPYFARFFQVSDRQIRRYVSQLEKLGWITNETIGRNRRRMRVTEKLEILKDISVPHVADRNVRQVGQKRPPAEGQKRPHSNTVLNNTENRVTALEFFRDPQIRERIGRQMVDRGLPEEVVGREIVKFVSYWTEPGKGRRVRWEAQSFFDISRRLATWFSKVHEYQRSKPKQGLGIAL